MKCELSSVQERFKEMSAAGWDTTSMLRYGYFFFSTDRDNLVAASEWLKDRDYEMVELAVTEEDPSVWRMQIAKNEVHNAESLHRRNEKMNELAEGFGIELYDGWDVEQL